MNIIKGIGRIVIVLALIATPIGFLIGWDTYKTEKAIEVRIPTKPNLTAEEYLEGSKGKSTPMSESGLSRDNPLRDLEIKGEIFQKQYHYQYRYPPNWQCAIAGIIGSIVAFLIIFFGISGITRVSLWIVEGFKDEKKGKNKT